MKLFDVKNKLFEKTFLFQFSIKHSNRLSCTAMFVLEKLKQNIECYDTCMI